MGFGFMDNWRGLFSLKPFLGAVFILFFESIFLSFILFTPWAGLLVNRFEFLCIKVIRSPVVLGDGGSRHWYFGDTKGIAL